MKPLRPAPVQTRPAPMKRRARPTRCITNSMCFARVLAAVCVVLSAVPAPLLRAQQSDLAQAKQAVSAYPGDPEAWEQLGVAQLKAGAVDDAVNSLQKALDTGYPATGQYNLACALARQGNVQRSLDLLDKLAKGGMPLAMAATDPDLIALRTEPRFTALLEQSRRKAEPCKDAQAHPEYRQLDFWVGRWDVFAPGGQKVGQSRVELILKDCVVYENWTGLAGGEGKSFNKYDPQKRRWEQFWVADNGTTTYFTGQAAPGQMLYTHEGADASGRPFVRRLTFTHLPDHRVRQWSQRSIDKGQTWTTEYDFTYVPATTETK